MTETMLERCARAHDPELWARIDDEMSRFPKDASTRTRRERSRALDDMRRVLSVLREPNERMTGAVFGCIKDGLKINDDAERSIRHGWRAAIDSILAENPQEQKTP